MVTAKSPRYGRGSQLTVRKTKKHLRRHVNANRFSGLETDDNETVTDDTSDGTGDHLVRVPTPTTTPTQTVLRVTPPVSTAPVVPTRCSTRCSTPDSLGGPSPAVQGFVKQYRDRYVDQTYHLMYGSQSIEPKTVVALPPSSDPHRKKTTVVAQSVKTRGETQSSVATVQFKVMACSGETATNNATVLFFGKCFYCHYLSHSQKYCPLRQCHRCKKYGHAETVCSFFI